MRFLASSALLVAGLSAMASATLGIGPMRPIYNSGDDAPIDYWADKAYEQLSMTLVHKAPWGWEGYDTFFLTDRISASNNTFTWRVREVAQGEQYAIYFAAIDDGFPHGGGNLTGYGALSNWFTIYNTPRKPALSPSQIAGVAVGGVVLCALVAGILFLVIRRRRASNRAQNMTPAEWRDSVDSISREKERAQVTMTETAA